MARLRTALLTIAFGAVLLPSAAPAVNGEGRLTEREIHRALDELPYEFTFRTVAFTGNGAVVAGTSETKGSINYFRIVSGHPDYDGRLLPKRPRSYLVGISTGDRRSPDDLYVRQTFGKTPAAKDMGFAIIDVLCAYRTGQPCGAHQAIRDRLIRC